MAKYQSSRWLLPDGIYGGTTDGFMFPPAGSVFGVDYSFGRPSPTLLAARGVKLAGRYLWNPRYQDGRTNKGLSRAEYDALTGVGIAPFYFYEESAEDPISGYAVGVAQAKAAEGYREANGLPPKPIYFPVDHDATLAETLGIIEGCRGAASIVGLGRTRLYGEYDVVRAAFDAGVISGACQTYAWSGGRWDDRAELRQWSNSHRWDNADIDFTRAMRADWQR